MFFLMCKAAALDAQAAKHKASLEVALRRRDERHKRELEALTYNLERLKAQVAKPLHTVLCVYSKNPNVFVNAPFCRFRLYVANVQNEGLLEEKRVWCLHGSSLQGEAAGAAAASISSQESVLGWVEEVLRLTTTEASEGPY